MDRRELFEVRDAWESDHNFIMATWLRGLRFGNDWFNLIDSNVYYKVYHDFLEALLKQPGVSVKVACLKDDPDVILGYSVSKEDRLDWVFVKSAWRDIGVGRSLLPQKISTVSHITKLGVSYLRKHPNIIFNPWSLAERN